MNRRSRITTEYHADIRRDAIGCGKATHVKLASIKQVPDALNYLERYVNEGTTTYSVVSQRTETAPRYRPTGRKRSFDLVTVHVPRDHLEITEAQPTVSLTNSTFGRHRLRSQFIPGRG